MAGRMGFREGVAERLECKFLAQSPFKGREFTKHYSLVDHALHEVTAGTVKYLCNSEHVCMLSDVESYETTILAGQKI